MSSAETLLAQAVAAINAGDHTAAAERFERAASILAAVRPTDAARALESAARLWLIVDNSARAARAAERANELEPGSARVLRVIAEVVDRIGDVPTRRDAWQAVADADDPALRRLARLQLATLSRAVADHASAAAHFEAALADLGDADPASRAELYLEIAISKTAAADLAGATTALAAAEALIGDADDAMRGRITGQRGLIALAKGDPETALLHGETARAHAVKRNDVMTYLAAASLIAMIYEQTDRLVEAYDTYVRTRESLGDLLGDNGRALGAPAIQVFEERLGPVKFKQVWDAWVAQRRQK
jgi:tetratricopeptide (TPR) repeat protein